MTDSIYVLALATFIAAAVWVIGIELSSIRNALKEIRDEMKRINK